MQNFETTACGTAFVDAIRRTWLDRSAVQAAGGGEAVLAAAAQCGFALACASGELNGDPAFVLSPLAVNVGLYSRRQVVDGIDM